MFPESFYVLVKANAPQTLVIEQIGDTYKIAVAAPAQDGKANAVLLQFLSKITKKKVKIISGKTSKKKLIKLY